MFGLFKKGSRNNVLVVFDDATVHHGEHGRAVVSCRKKQYNGKEVSFAFIGVLDCPTLTRENVNLVYEEAAKQGYVVHEITKYGSAINQE